MADTDGPPLRNFCDHAALALHGLTSGSGLAVAVKEKVPRFDLAVMRSGPEAAGKLVTDGGELIARLYGSEVPVVAKALRGESGVEVQVNPIEKEERVSAYEPVTGYGWGVIATQPTATAFALRRNALNRLVLIYGIIVLLSGGLAATILNNLAQRKKADRGQQDGAGTEQRPRAR